MMLQQKRPPDITTGAGSDMMFVRVFALMVLVVRFFYRDTFVEWLDHLKTGVSDSTPSPESMQLKEFLVHMIT